MYAYKMYAFLTGQDDVRSRESNEGREIYESGTETDQVT